MTIGQVSATINDLSALEAKMIDALLSASAAGSSRASTALEALGWAPDPVDDEGPWNRGPEPMLDRG